MSAAWPYLLAPFALLFSSLCLEANIWFIYGYATYRDGKHTRRSFRVLLVAVILLALLAFLAPWFFLIFGGFRAANAAWFGLGLGSCLAIYLMGLFVEWHPALFYDRTKERRITRDIRHRDDKLIQGAIQGWPLYSPEERQKFLQAYGAYPIHIREAVFLRLLDSFPIIDGDVSTPGTVRLNGEQLMSWAGAHLSRFIEALFEIRTRLDHGVFRGPLPVQPATADHPEALGEIVFARTGEDRFIIGPAA